MRTTMALTLAYVTTYDATDPLAWSGTGRCMAEALRAAGARVELVGPVDRRTDPVVAMRRLAYGRGYLRDRDPRMLRHYAQTAERRLRRLRPDAVVSPGSLPVCCLDARWPACFWTDATFASLLGFYPEFSRLRPESVLAGHQAEAMALDRCALACYSSAWAADSAVRHYGADRAKVRVVPFGCNLRPVPSPGPRRWDRCRLLLVGVDWHRKGADLAVRAGELLVASGIPVELTIVGCLPPAGTALPPWVRLDGFVSKATEAGRARLAGLYGAAHALLLPSRAECVAMVIAEASCHGTPVAASAVGGIPSAVVDGANGRCFDLEGWPEAAAAWIGDLWRRPAEHAALSRAAVEHYRRHLTWEGNARRLLDLLAERC